MADLPFLRASDNGSDYGNSDYFSDAGQNDFLLDDQEGFQDQEQVLPLQKINVFLQSDNVYTRQAIARNLMDCLQRASNPDERQTVLNAVKTLACDPEPSVKAECVEQLPRLIIYCHENQGTVDPQDAVANYLLQAAVCSLHDSTSQVRKSAQLALVNMLEHKLISEGYLEELVLPSLLELLVPDSVSEDLRIETVGLLTKACTLITSHDIIERVLLPKFCELCADNLFHVRKVCAASFGELCTVAGPKLTEELLTLPPVNMLPKPGTHYRLTYDLTISKKKPLAYLFFTAFAPSESPLCALKLHIVTKGKYETVLYSIPLPKFLSLCEDGVWGVRKACTECFMLVSSSCSINARMGELARAFSTLLIDQSRWVRMGAFQALGPFISTFAGHDLALYIDEDGALRVREPPESPPTAKAVASEKVSDGKSCDESSAANQDILAGDTNANSRGCTSSQSCNGQKENELKLGPRSDDDASLEELMWQMFHKTGGANSSNGDDVPAVNCKAVEGPDKYSSLSYWREPLPDIDLPLPSSTTNQVPADASDSLNTKHTEVADGSTSMPASGSTPAGSNDISSLDDDLDRLASKLGATLTSPQPDRAASNELCVLAEQGSGSPQQDITLVETPAQLDATKNVSHAGTSALPSSAVNPSLTGTALHDTAPTVAHRGTADTGAKMFDFSTASILPEFQMSSFNSFSPANYGYHRRSSSGSSAGEPTMADHYAHEQSVIPPVLLENYLSMAEPSKAQSVDSDIARHCAFSFPAVAFTLGKENWKCLKELYEALASDVQWKVRRTLAFSIHDVAVILGREATERDLMPIFDGFLKDLDEVKIGVLKHLADFLKLMDLKLRKTYLPRFRDFLETDNTRNWRFRYDLAEQMILLVDLFEPEDVSEYLVPLGITLLSDRVSEVRLITYNFVSKVVKHLQGDSYRKLRLMVVNDLIAKFARSGRWLHRQMFIHICGVLLDDGALSPDQFAKDLLPSVFALASDPVPNVRMAVSKLLFVNLVKHDFFTTSSNPHHTELAAACTVLRGDSDRDVRFYGCPPMHVSASVETVFDGSAECLTDVIRDVSPSREASIPIGQVD